MARHSGLRALTVAVSAFLAFDGVALVLGGLWLARPLLYTIGSVLIAGSLLVGVYWRWHVRQLTDIATARHALSAEARQLQDFVHRN